MYIYIRKRFQKQKLNQRIKTTKNVGYYKKRRRCRIWLSGIELYLTCLKNKFATLQPIIT